MYEIHYIEDRVKPGGWGRLAGWLRGVKEGVVIYQSRAPRCGRSGIRFIVNSDDAGVVFLIRLFRVRRAECRQRAEGAGGRGFLYRVSFFAAALSQLRLGLAAAAAAVRPAASERINRYRE